MATTYVFRSKEYVKTWISWVPTGIHNSVPRWKTMKSINPPEVICTWRATGGSAFVEAVYRQPCHGIAVRKMPDNEQRYRVACVCSPNLVDVKARLRNARRASGIRRPCLNSVVGWFLKNRSGAQFVTLGLTSKSSLW